ncbi:putative transcriptional regulator [Pseudomonas aeruginosa]|nr:putative transcriptional regulator [Pseudomonas aeruginosa]
MPTWNYRVVHAHGRVRIRDDERYVRGLVARLTRTHEATQETPWKMTDGPADYIDEMLRLIVGIEIEITRLVGKFKLSQNKEARDIRGASAALLARGEQAIGAAMDDCRRPARRLRFRPRPAAAVVDELDHRAVRQQRIEAGAGGRARRPEDDLRAGSQQPPVIGLDVVHQQGASGAAERRQRLVAALQQEEGADRGECQAFLGKVEAHVVGDALQSS